jgi:hypothetical protein
MSAIPNIIFPNEQSTNITAEFDVEDSIGILKFHGLPEKSRLLIESYFGKECNTTWIPTIFCCKQMATSDCSTHMIIPLPGKFRAVLVNEDDSYITDPEFFSDTQITFERHKISHDISSFFQLCC